jgi:energy-coupling factor transporter transmembrane protein EcfT
MQLYCKKESFFHSLDARIKLALLFFLLLLQIFLPLDYGLAMFALVFLLYYLSGISLPGFAASHRFLLILPLLPALVRVVFEKGTVEAYGMVLPSGIYYGALNFLFLFSLVLMPILFGLTTPPAKIASALRFFGMPPRLSFMFSIAFVSVAYVSKKAHKTLLAQRCRGSPASPAALLLPVLHACFRRSRKMSLSLAARGFDASEL